MSAAGQDARGAQEFAVAGTCLAFGATVQEDDGSDLLDTARWTVEPAGEPQPAVTVCRAGWSVTGPRLEWRSMRFHS